ncbi:MAG: tRNA 2-thiouridine(34) synthase MnmA [Acidimicrobiales bacterium]
MRVLVAMSGGVDSSVAAALLQRDGHDVTGVTMKLWGGESDTGCCSVSDVDDARRVADQLGIDHHVFNFGPDFERHVVGPYVDEHRAGRTPNPCIECNRHLKFARLSERASLLGFDALATGHHARIVVRPDGTRRVARGADGAKDQSYVVHMLDQVALGRTCFPVGRLTKAEVRALAADLGLRTAAKPDSQDVCFITSREGRQTFVAGRTALTPGRVIDGTGRDLGRVDAVELVTIGQRSGLGLAGGHEPVYAVATDPASATVTVGSAQDLDVSEQPVGDVGWAAGAVTGTVLVQVSAHGTPAGADIDPRPAATVVVRWHEPQRRVAPGQSVVFYDGDEVVGGGLAD